MPLIIEDTQDFLKRISKISKIWPNALLISFKIPELFFQIPQNEGIKVMWPYSNECDDQTVSIESLRKLAEIVVKNSFFENEDKMSQ